MKWGKWLLVGVVVAGLAVVIWRWWPLLEPIASRTNILRQPLEKYDFNELKKRGGKGSEIKIIGEAKDIKDRRQEEVDFETKVFVFESNGKRVSGVINYWPSDSEGRPVVIMLRGYADKSGYYPGSGSWRVADALASEGYVTVAVDFLGYGMSQEESADVLEARFEKVVTVIDLIEAVKRLNFVDPKRMGIWAHSNGGQIAMSVLEVTGGNYPTVLWAPMTNPFPQSLIGTADEGEERSKATEFVNIFLKKYDGRRYAFENYYQWIKAPILIQQGNRDVWCKVEWQEKVVAELVALGKQAKLIIYPGADHNLAGPKGSGWEEAVAESKNFFLITMLNKND